MASRDKNPGVDEAHEPPLDHQDPNIRTPKRRGSEAEAGDHAAQRGIDEGDVRGGALPRDYETLPPDVQDTQESLYSEEGLWAVAEKEGEGKRNADPQELEIEADGLTVRTEEDV